MPMIDATGRAMLMGLAIMAGTVMACMICANKFWSGDYFKGEK